MIDLILSLPTWVLVVGVFASICRLVSVLDGMHGVCGAEEPVEFIDMSLLPGCGVRAKQRCWKSER